jgi:hypothetical protein
MKKLILLSVLVIASVSHADSCDDLTGRYSALNCVLNESDSQIGIKNELIDYTDQGTTTEKPSSACQVNLKKNLDTALLAGFSDTFSQDRQATELRLKIRAENAELFNSAPDVVSMNRYLLTSVRLVEALKSQQNGRQLFIEFFEKANEKACATMTNMYLAIQGLKQKSFSK